LTDDYRQWKQFKDHARGIQLRGRIDVLRVLLALVFLCYLGPLWYYQVVRADYFRALSESNRIRTVAVTPLRGTIVDREGRVLAKNRPSFTVVVDQVEPGRWEETRDHLGQLLELEPVVLEERHRRAGDRIGPEGIVVQEDSDLAQAAYIESHPERFPGVRVQVEPRRLYEGGRWAPHLIGYVGEVSAGDIQGREFPGARPGDVVGKAGLERRFNGDLVGKRGNRKVVVNARGHEIDEVTGGNPSVPGSTLQLALDLDLQQAMAEAFDGRAGSGVVVDPRTGEILALASFPTFDPNLFAGRFTREGWEQLARDPAHPLQNRAAQSQFSAGSTFKVVVAMAALETGALVPDRRIFCPGYAVIYGRRFRCHFGGGHGWVDLHEALVKSCNVYFYQVGRELGIEPIAEYARLSGLGRPTGVDMLLEDSGLVPGPEWSERVRGTPWYPGETISVSVGQGPLLVTPLQMVALAGALGTGQFQPLHLVQRLNGQPVEPPSAPRRLEISSETLEVIRRALWGVVNEWGTGWQAKLTRFPEIEVAGKTGTVQVVRSSAGVDSEDLPKEVRDHSWFIGYAPADRPTIAFAIFVEHGGHGGREAAPIARKILDAHFHKQIAPQEVALAQ